MLSCGRQSIQPRSTVGAAVLRLNLPGEPRSLDPRRGDRRAQVVSRILFDSLTRVSPGEIVTPAMADEITLSDDRRTYTFHLREAFWSNGMPVRASDFAWAWREMVAPDFDSPFSYAFYPIKNAEAAKKGEVSVHELGVKAIDERTLVVELEHPAPYFLYLVSSPLFAPVCEAVAAKDPRWWCEGGDTFVCNGPYCLERWKHGEEIELHRNPRYWDVGAVGLDRVTFSMVEDPHTTLELFERGQLDWAGEPLSELPLSALDRLREEGKLKICPAGGIYQLKLNVEQGPLSSVAFRRALASAIDRREIIDHILKGDETVATSIVPPVLTLGGGLLIDGNLEHAHRFLAEALEELGYSLEEVPPLRLTYATLEGHKALAQAIQNQWQKGLGIQVELQGMEWNTYFASMARGEVQIGGAPWYSWHNDASFNLNHVRSKSARYNSTRWEHPTYQALLHEADYEIDLDRRAQLLREAEQFVVEQAPLVPLYVTTYKYVATEDLSGVFIGELGHVDLKWARLKSSPNMDPRG